jgi:hypothetical protein
MGAMAAKYQPGGFLYYALNRWLVNEKVITGGPRTDWNPASYKENNGDGSILCAGPNGPLATIRLENIRDGMSALVRLSGFSHGHLCRLMKEYFNMTPNSFISDIRMVYAANLLLNSLMDTTTGKP